MRHQDALQPIEKVIDKGAAGWFRNGHPRACLVRAWSLLPNAAPRPVVTRLDPGARYFIREDAPTRHELEWIKPRETAR